MMPNIKLLRILMIQVFVVFISIIIFNYVTGSPYDPAIMTLGVIFAVVETVTAYMFGGKV